VADVDGIVHLAGIPHQDTFERILQTNVAGTFNVFEAARRQGCGRVVVASSLHVTGFYDATQRISPEAPVRPDSFYGLGKACGENLGRLYADKHGLAVVCVRIGTFAEQPTTPRHLSTWLSPRDAVELFYRSLVAPDVGSPWSTAYRRTSVAGGTLARSIGLGISRWMTLRSGPRSSTPTPIQRSPATARRAARTRADRPTRRWWSGEGGSGPLTRPPETGPPGMRVRSPRRAGGLREATPTHARADRAQAARS
jgi:NAD(P)-dependent dehydrogenase (short-subunit alcohol dehydrogenase family)